MKDKRDQLEQMLQDEFDKVARKEEDVLMKNKRFAMPKGKKDKIYRGIREKIEEAERESLYKQLSEEDQKALALGRKIMEQEKEKKKEAQTRVVRKKPRIRVYVGLVAALVAVLAIGVTSIGGAERLIKMMTQVVGEREVAQVDSSDDNYIMAEESEEEAYQKINDKFGVESVRIVYKMKDMEFQKMEFEEESQTAEMFYKYNGKVIIYLINASYVDISLGIDVDDKLIKTTEKEIHGCKMEIKEYRLSDTGAEKYSAHFKYNGLEYCLIANVNSSEFDLIINNLIFT